MFFHSLASFSRFILVLSIFFAALPTGLIIYSAQHLYYPNAKNFFDAQQAIFSNVENTLKSVTQYTAYFIQDIGHLIKKTYNDDTYIKQVINSLTLSDSNLLCEDVNWVPSTVIESFQKAEFFTEKTIYNQSNLDSNIFNEKYNFPILRFAVIGDDGEYLGYISYTIPPRKIAHLIQTIDKSNSLNYGILNEQGEYVWKYPFADTILPNGTNESKKLAKYCHYFSLPPSYKILLCSNSNALNQNLISLSIPLFAFFIAVASLSIFYILSKRHVYRPLSNILNITNKLSYNSNYNFPEYKIEELNNLAKQIKGFAQQCSQIKEIKQDLKAKSTDAKIAHKVKFEFLSSITHELRTPLNIIISFSEIMKKQSFGPLSDKKYVDYSNAIYSAGKGLLAIIDDLIDVSKLQAGTLTLNKKEINIQNLLANICNTFAELANQKEVKILESYNADHASIIGDNVKIKQAFIHLISNAIKFNNRGGEVKIITENLIKSSGKSTIVVTIIDTGLGMTQAQLRNIFHSFSKIENSLNRRFEGTGIGLSLAKKFIEMHQATINIKSEVAHGTQIIIQFPENIVIANTLC